MARARREAEWLPFAHLICTVHHAAGNARARPGDFWPFEDEDAPPPPTMKPSEVARALGLTKRTKKTGAP